MGDSGRTTTSMSTIAGWLDGLGLAQYVPVFAENGIAIDVLFDLTEADLEKLGIPLATASGYLELSPAARRVVPHRERG